MTIVVLFSTNAYLDYLCLFIVGISVTMRYYIGYTYNVEMQPHSHQVLAGSMQFIAEAIVFLFVCYYFYKISKYWRPLQIPNIVLTTIGLVFIYRMPETPRFLVSVHKFEKARTVFKTMARWNGKSPTIADSFLFHEEHPAHCQTRVAKEPSVKELWKVKLLRRNLIGSTILWSCSAFNFYLLTFFLKYFPGNIYENSFFFGIADFIAYAGSGLLLKRTNVVTALYIAFLIDFTGGILYIMFHNNLALVPIIICICRGGVTMTYNIGYVSPKELFPTLFIATVYGQVNVFAHIIACLAPMVAETAYPIPFCAYLVAIGISCFAAAMLTEISDDDKEKDFL
jgi:MFS family permease